MHTLNGMVETLGRVMIGGMFLFQGGGAIQRFDFHVGRLRTYNIPGAGFILCIGFAMMFTGGAMVVFNIFSAVGAMLLLVFTVTATILFQNFWSIDEPKRRREKRTSFHVQLGYYWRNIANNRARHWIEWLVAPARAINLQSSAPRFRSGYIECIHEEANRRIKPNSTHEFD